MAYHHDNQLYKKKKRSRRLMGFSLILLVSASLVGGFIFLDWLGGLFRSNTVVSSTNQASVQSASINIFQTEYFRFQANDSWREVTDQYENPPNEYIYRSYDSGLIEHELWITVNKEKDYSLEKHYPTRVMPVEIVGDGRLRQTGSTSDRCIFALTDDPTGAGVNQDPQILTQEGISYFCHPNSTAYNVTLGILGGTNTLPMPRLNGSKMPVTIIYKNVTAYPDTRQLEQIISTFRTI